LGPVFNPHPHIRELKKYRMHYILGAKKDDHAFLFDHVESATKEGLTTEIDYAPHLLVGIVFLVISFLLFKIY
jgi:hypothetical protein